MTKRERNNLLKKAYSLLDQAYDLIIEANEAEQESYGNWADSLQGTWAYEIAEGRANMLDDAATEVEELRDKIENIMNDEVQ